jgi:ubiquinone/menaquinone biosynthesis C-methylase UbiE
MNFSKYIAAQLRKPTGSFGRNVMIHLLNMINRPINSLAFEVLQLSPNDNVLEIGFGGGNLLAEISRVTTRGKVTGVDFSQDVVDACSKRFKRLNGNSLIELYCANVMELPFEAKTFSRVCTVNTIYFWSDLERAFSQIHRVLKDEGMVVVCFSPKVSMQARSHKLHGFILYDPENVISILTATGFRNIRYVTRGLGSRECVAVFGIK